MMKKSIALIMAVMLCLSCAACGTKKGTVDSSTTNKNSKSVVINSKSVVPPVSSSVVPNGSDTSKKQKSGSVVQEETNKKTKSSSLPETEKMFTEINRYVLTPEDQYYLNDDKEEGYKKALDAVMNHESKVDLPYSYDDNLSILGYLQQSPYTFVLSSFDITKNHKGMSFEYKYSAEECTEMMDFIDQEYLKILNETITPDMTELEKVLAIHRYFASRIEYNYDWVDALNMSDEQYMFPDIVIYEALKTNKGVCHTYTYLCEFAFEQLGIKCTKATTEMVDSDDGHMWLIVWINGKPYHVDPTWDRNGDQVSLQYFGMTDTENCDRGLQDEWSCSIDTALDIDCSDERFEDLRDVTDYKLIGDHKMEVERENGSTDIVDLTDYES